jgi:hypothetical protein
MAIVVIRTADLDRRAYWHYWEPNKELREKLQAAGPHTLQVDHKCHSVRITVEDLELGKLYVGEGTRVHFFSQSITIYKADCSSPVEAGKIKVVGGPLRFAGGGTIQKIVATRGECIVHGPKTDSSFELILREKPGQGVTIAPGTRVRILPAKGVWQPPLSGSRNPVQNTDREAELRGPAKRHRTGPF